MHALIKLTAFAVVLALSSSSIVKSPSSSGDNFELLILHNNDMHARFEQTSQLSGTCTTEDREAGKCYGGFPRVAYVVKEARRKAASGEGPPVLYLNAGDTYTGTAWFTIYKWKVAAEFINALQPDAVSLGNHEFDNGVNGLTPFIENINTPVLAANLILSKTPELAKETNLKKSIVIDVSGHKVGIVGYLTPDTKILAVKNDVEYIDEIIALKEEVSNLKSQGCKIIIALGHSGFTKDLEIGKEVDGIDLVIRGHSNTFLWNGSSPDSEEIQGPYPTYVEQVSGKFVPVVQAYAYTKYLGKLHLVFDNNGNIISADGNPVLLNSSIPQDDDTLKIVESYRVQVNNATQARMGTSLVPLDGLNCQRMECNFGNLIADAMIYTYAISYTGKYWTDAPIAIIQGGGIRASIAHTTKPAVITRGDLLTVLPFKGSISKVTMNGSVLLEMIEHSVSRYNVLDFPGEFLQYSGIKVVYDFKLPSKSRVVAAKARCGGCDIPQYSEIENDKTYNVLMPTFVADGGDGFSMLVGLPRETYPYDELYCLKTYLQRYSDVMPEVDGRSILLNVKVVTSLSIALLPPNSGILLLVLFAIFQ